MATDQYNSFVVANRLAGHTQAQPVAHRHAEHIQIHGIDPKHKKGLRTVATIEFSKGVGGVLVAFGLLSLLHKDLWDVADNLLQFFHINPDHHFAQTILDLADRVTDAQLWGFASGALAYSTIRFIEAYGLWRTRVWAEWLAILSGLIYLPFEIHGLWHKSTAFRWSVLLINLGLVGYVAYVRFSEEKRRRRVLAAYYQKDGEKSPTVTP